jgi:hypothetical protein
MPVAVVDRLSLCHTSKIAGPPAAGTGDNSWRPMALHDA